MANISNSLTVQSDLKNLSIIRSFVEDAADNVGLSKEATSGMRLAVDEACANIILHGYKNSEGEIEVSVHQDGPALVVTLSDEAPLYNPLEESSKPDLDAPLEMRALGGMGVLLVQQNTDAVEYRKNARGGNTLILTKSFSEPSART